MNDNLTTFVIYYMSGWLPLISKINTRCSNIFFFLLLVFPGLLRFPIITISIAIATSSLGHTLAQPLKLTQKLMELAFKLVTRTLHGVQKSLNHGEIPHDGAHFSVFSLSEQRQNSFIAERIHIILGHVGQTRGHNSCSLIVGDLEILHGAHQA
eukprot:m.14178 g.14178  ORF g.14178 m.14178 type:complete len:154 (+) comp6350_c0_seq2:2318-2779(+)